MSHEYPRRRDVRLMVGELYTAIGHALCDGVYDHEFLTIVRDAMRDGVPIEYAIMMAVADELPITEAETHEAFQQRTAEARAAAVEDMRNARCADEQPAALGAMVNPYLHVQRAFAKAMDQQRDEYNDSFIG